MMRSRFAMACMVMTMLLAACSAPAPAATQGGAGQAGPAATPGAAQSATQAAAPSSSDSVKIGLLIPLTGPQASVGMESQDGLNLYLASTNNTLAGRKVEVIAADTQGQADIALTKARQLVESNHVSLLMGLVNTPECYAIADYVKQAQVPTLISTACSAQLLMTDPKYRSPYLSRITFTGAQAADPTIDWAWKQGYRKADLMIADAGGGLEVADLLSSAFIQRGGSIIQEQYVAPGTADYAPYVTQIDPSADVIFVFLNGSDAINFVKTYPNYVQKKLPMVAPFGNVATGPFLSAEGDAGVGIVSNDTYLTALQTPENQTYIQAWNAKYPNRPISGLGPGAWAAGEMVNAALQKVNGQVEGHRQEFLAALQATDMQTIVGPIKLDENHEIVRNMYITRSVKQGNTLTEELVDTYEQVKPTGLRTVEDITRIPLGQMKGKWTGMTRDQLAQLGH